MFNPTQVNQTPRSATIHSQNTYMVINTSSNECILTIIQYISLYIEVYAHRTRHEHHCKANASLQTQQ